MRNRASAASAQRDLSHQELHRRTSSFPQPPAQSFDSYEILRRDLTSPSADRKKSEDALNKPRPSLLPYQEYHSGYTGADEELLDKVPSYVPSWGGPSKHTRHQSFTNFIPTVLKSRTPSPIRKTAQQVVHTTEETDQEMGFTGDGRARRGTVDSPRTGLPGWLNGGSIRGLPQSMEGIFNPEPRPGTPHASPRKNSLATMFTPEPITPTGAKNSVTSRWMSAISTRLALPQSPANTAPNRALDDELCTMDLETALFPSGSPTDRDAFSPAAYKNLQLNAMGLLTKLQNAYRQKTVTMREMEAESAVQRDEIEEAVTRATHLKMQLEGMASKALEQELAMRDLMDQLMAEKKARAEEKIVRERLASRYVISPPASEDFDSDAHSHKTWRESRGSYDTEDEEESSLDESLFSRSRSPTLAEASVLDYPTPKAGRARNSAQMTTFQKIIKGVVDVAEEIGQELGTVQECRNCAGKEASVAWDTVSLLRDENKHLKQRVGQLEVAVEGALDLVNGLGHH